MRTFFDHKTLVSFLIRSNDQRAAWDLTHDNFLEKVKIMTLTL